MSGGLEGPETGVRIRPATPDDEPFLRDLFGDVHAATFARMGLPEAMIPLLLEQQFRAQRAGYAQGFPAAEYLVIERERGLVGRLTLALVETARGRSLNILDICLLSKARGQGIGTGVLAGLEDRARAIGASELSLMVASTNEGARRLYERLGFVATDIGMHIGMVRKLA